MQILIHDNHRRGCSTCRASAGIFVIGDPPGCRNREYLERWAHEHPTHHAILNGMAAFAEQHGTDLQVVLGHEVYVAPPGHAQAEYSGCHLRTGFLRFFPGHTA